MKKDRISKVIGIIIVLIGIVFLGNSLKIWNINIFFDGWWTLFITVPAIIDIFKGENLTASLMIFLIGMILMLACQGLIVWKGIGKLIVPILIICFGLSLLFKHKTGEKSKLKKKNDETSKDNNFTAILGENTLKVNDKFNGGNCVAAFGKVSLDLTKTDIKEDAVLDTMAIFGNVEVITPENVDVKATGKAVFGSTNDKVKHSGTKKMPTIYINYTCIFGKIDIK